MGAVRVDVLCECDNGRCAKRFGVELELAIDLNGRDDVDFDDLVRELVLNGNGTYYIWGVRGKSTVDRYPLKYSVTIQRGMLLCDECSEKCDKIEVDGAPVNGELNDEQFERALGIRPDEDEVGE